MERNILRVVQKGKEVTILSEKIVIIGDGIAAVTAAKVIREYDKISEIHLLGKERFYPYNRMRLSKGFLNTLEEDKILLQKKRMVCGESYQLMDRYPSYFS